MSAAAENPDPIQIHENVIATIIRKTASRIEGVAGISGNKLVNTLAEWVGSSRMKNRAITIEMTDSAVKADLSVSFYFGCKIQEVAAELKNAVTAEIERITGLRVEAVNVIVRSMKEREPEKTE